VKYSPAPSEQLRQLVEAEHGGEAVTGHTVQVLHVAGDLVWEATVHVFGLKRNPNATKAFAWTCPRDGENHVVLKSHRIARPVEAVRSVVESSGWGPRFDGNRVRAAAAAQKLG
jgi:hypothetical protein